MNLKIYGNIFEMHENGFENQQILKAKLELVFPNFDYFDDIF